MKTTTSSHPRRSGGVRLELGFKKRKCLQSRTRHLRGGKKTYPRVTSPFFLAEPRWSSSPFLLPREKKNRVFFFNPQKALARLLQSSASGCFRGVWSFLLRSRGPRSSAGTSSGLAGAQGQKMLRRRRRLRPAGLTARGRAARRRRAPGGSRALALLGASCSLMRGPPAPPPLAAAGRRDSPQELLAPTRLRRRGGPGVLKPPPPPRLCRRAREPPCPPSALSWRSGSSAAAGGSPRRTQGLRGRTLGSSAPAGWLCLRQLSPARRADRARRPAGSAGAARGQGAPCAERVSECARGSPPPARPPAPAPFPPPSSPFAPRPQPPPPPPPPPRPPLPPLGPSALLVPLRSGAPGSGLVTWPSRHPVALKKKKSDCVSQTTDRVSKSYFSPRPPATATPSPVCKGGDH